MIENAGGKGYNTQQVAELLDLHTRNIDLLDEKIKTAFWGLSAILVIFQILNFWLNWRFDKRLKKLEK